MINKVKKKIDKVLLQLSKIDAADGRKIEVRNIVYFASESRKIVAYTDNKTKKLERLRVKYSINELEKMFRGLFIRIHREYLVNIDRVCGVSRRYFEKDEDEVPELEDVPIEGRVMAQELALLQGLTYEVPFALKSSFLNEGLVYLKGFDVRLPLTNTYSRKFKKAFGLKHLHHLVPEHSHDKFLRLHGLIDFGWRELYKLDVKDKKAVEAFKKKWYLRDFSEEKLKSYFRRIGSDDIDIRRMTQNFLFQLFRWIQKGIEPPVNGNIRSLWYRIKPLIGKVADLLDGKNVDVFYDALHEMIEVHKLFKYKDFGLIDVNADVRQIGQKRPEIIIAVEKEGLKSTARRLAREIGCTHICLKGEPAAISMEYFTDELKEVLETDQEVEIFMYVDIDPAGNSIQKNFKTRLEDHGIKIKRIVDLVKIDLYTDEDIEWDRYPIGRYEIVNGEEIPVKPANQSRLTKVLDWYRETMSSDKRLMEVKEIDGKIYYTIHGLESDSADQSKVRKLFLKEVKS